jgi:hemolysin D
MKSASKVIEFPRRNNDERAFLPAALEIVETPASPAGRAVAISIAIVLCFSAAWATFAKVDVVASASGKIVLAGGTKTIQPFETSVVRAIHVHDGQRVVAGEPLIELDPTINEAERDHSEADLVAAQLDVARLKAALSDADDPLTAFVPPANASSAAVEMQREYLAKQTAEYRAKIDALDRQCDQKKAEYATIEATITKLSTIIPLVQQRVDIRKTSSDREYTSKFQYYETLQSLVEEQQELLVQKSHLREVDASIAALVVARKEAIAEYQRTMYGQLADAQRKANGLAFDVEKSQQKIKAQFLTSPIDGTVQELAIHTIGGIVTPAQALLSVVPGEGRLEIEAMVMNRDIGFVAAGQNAAIKVDTFNFTRYGLLHGKVISVSKDAVIREKALDEASGRAPRASEPASESGGQELNFPARISLDRTQMRIDDKEVNLTPGMAVTVEIKTGRRSVMSYLLSPLARYGHDALRER